MDFSWFGVAIVIGIGLFIGTTVWDELDLLTGITTNIWGGIMILGALIVIAAIIKPFFFPSQQRQ